MKSPMLLERREGWWRRRRRSGVETALLRRGQRFLQARFAIAATTDRTRLRGCRRGLVCKEAVQHPRTRRTSAIPFLNPCSTHRIIVFINVVTPKVQNFCEGHKPLFPLLLV
jgi:hypothetical protein